MEKNVIDFIRKVVLDMNVPFDIREDALNLLIKNSMPTGGGSVETDMVTIKYPGWHADEPLQTATISRETYKKASEFIRASYKINAIKEIRNEAKIGLKEAKEATEMWDFNL